MKKLLSLLLALAMIVSLAACGSGGSNTTTAAPTTTQPGSPATTESPQPAKPDPSTYTTFTELYSSELKTLDYLDSTLTALSTFAYNCEMGLVYFDNFGLMRPGVAKNWSISDDGTVYTFYLRDNINWVDHKGNVVTKVTAHDFVTAAQHILDQENPTGVANTLYNNLAGAKAFFDKETTDFGTVGIKALDDYTLQYTLIGPSAYFLRMLGNNVWFPIPTDFYKEHKETFGTSCEDLLYNGAYYCSSYEYEYERVMKKNEDYLNANLITIGTVTYRYNKEASANGAELFLRGDTDKVTLTNDIAKEWMNDDAKKDKYHTAPLNNMSYWIAFNFDPQYEAEYEPENWKVAVNNVNFRKAFFYGFNSHTYNSVINEWNYAANTLTTYSRQDLVSVGSKDYLELGGLDEYSKLDYLFDEAKALEFKAAALKDLEGKVTLPVKIKVTYNTSGTTSTRYQVMEQQLEKVLGSDFIDLILVPYSGSSFNADVRNAGDWAMMELGWGPDFADPMSQFDPMLKTSIGKNWGKVYLATEYYDASLEYGEVEKAALKADAIKDDFDARYIAFAEAEKIILDQALVVPCYRGGGGFQASRIVPFTQCTGQMGDGGARNSVVFAKIADHPISEAEYQAAKEQYLKDRDAAREAYAKESAEYQIPAK